MERTDEQLVSAILAGDRAAFDVLMRRYERLVYKVVHGFCRNREDALDLTQTVFLKAFRGLPRYRADSSLKTWLLRIAQHEAIDWGRRPGNREPALVAPEREAAGVQPATQEVALVASEQQRLLATGLNSLNPRARTAVVLRYLHRWPIREIAGLLEVSETRTKNILVRGVRSLKKAVAESA